MEDERDERDEAPPDSVGPGAPLTARDAGEEGQPIDLGAYRGTGGGESDGDTAEWRTLDQVRENDRGEAGSDLP